MKKSEIKFVVTLDKENIPEKIEWMAEDSINTGLSETKSISLSLWDEKKNNTLRIDLWTKEMLVNDMFIFYHQTLMSMANTLEKSTGHDKLAGALKDYCEFFAEQTKIIDSN